MEDHREYLSMQREPTESEEPMSTDQDITTRPQARQQDHGRITDTQEPSLPKEPKETSDREECAENLTELIHDVALEDKNPVFPPPDFTGPSADNASDTPTSAANQDESGNERTHTPTQHPPDVTASQPEPKLRRKSSSLAVKTLTLPKVNCPEKIFLCVDHSEAMFRNKFQTQSANQTSAFKTLTSAIKQFVCTKSFLNKKHQFSLVMLNEDAQLITDFSSNPEESLFMLNDIAESPPALSVTRQETEVEPTFDLSTLFNIIKQQAGLPRMNMNQAAKMPPPHIVRAIIIYGRSGCKPTFVSGQKSLNLLNKSPFFFLDFVYIHEPPSADNYVEEIFSEVCSLDARGVSHIHEVGIESNIAALYNVFAKLLAHPLQRPKQGENPLIYNLEGA